MPTPPASRTALLLSTRSFVPRSQTTILPATLAGSRTPRCPGVQVRREAQLDAASGRRRRGRRRSRGRSARRARPAPMPTPVKVAPSPSGDGRPGRRGRGCRRRPWSATGVLWATVRGARAVVAGRRGDEHARVRRRSKNATSTGSTSIGQAAGDRVVDDVDAVGDGGVDGGDQVGRSCRWPSSPVFQQGLVGRDAGVRGHAASQLPSEVAVDHERDVVVAGGGARGVRAVAVRVARRDVLEREPGR